MRFNLDNYETVEQRLAKFWEQFPNGQVFTQIHHYDETRVVFRAEVYKDITDPRPVATGYAEETRDASPVNRTSHVENAETSAIGRALANYIFQSKAAPRPSREEMAKVQRMNDIPSVATATQEFSKRLSADMLTRFREACAKKGLDPQDVAKEAGVDLNELTDADMPRLRDKFQAMKNAAPVEPKRDEILAAIQESFPGAQEDKPTIKDPDSPISQAQLGKVRAMLSGAGVQSLTDKRDKCSEIINRPLERMEQLTKGEASRIIEVLESRASR
jgi:hypothetical protein